MKTPSQTTTILLDRGTEDERLLAELQKLIRTAGLEKSTRKFIEVFPLTHELISLLRNEHSERSDHSVQE